MSLPSPPPKYDQMNEAQFRNLVDQALAQCLKKGVDIEIAGGVRLILTDTATGARKYLKLTSGTLGTGSV